MSESNGKREVIRIGRKGRRWLALGEGEPFEIDVIEVHQQWLDVHRGFQDKDGNVPPADYSAVNNAAWEFARQASGTADITLAEALEFLAVVTREVNALKDFFEVGSPSAPGSPASTAGLTITS